MWNPKEETRSRDELSRLQNQRLRDLVHRVHERVPFYKRKMEERGVSSSDIREISDITKLPFTTKDEMRDAYPLGLLAVDRSARLDTLEVQVEMNDRLFSDKIKKLEQIERDIEREL